MWLIKCGFIKNRHFWAKLKVKRWGAESMSVGKVLFTVLLKQQTPAQTPGSFRKFF